MIIDIPGSPGELIDRIAILELKSRHFTDAAKRTTVERQLARLQALWDGQVAQRAGAEITSAGIVAAIGELRQVNAILWDVEEDLRALEAKQDFGPRFVELARSVYRTNDRRAAAKRRIDAALGSTMIEEKSYVTKESAAPGARGGQP
ncbi:MAG: hypothetical protein ABI439_07660 [Rhodospirillales bacterium]